MRDSGTGLPVFVDMWIASSIASRDTVDPMTTYGSLRNVGRL